MGIKIKDIAEALGLSQATVSLVLNNKHGVGSDTRERVIQYAKEAGYEVNMALKQPSVTTKRVRFIIYSKHSDVVSDLPAFSEFAKSVEFELRKYDYELVISYINEDDDKSEILRLVHENPLDGIIILASQMDMSDIKDFRFAKVPIVLVDSYFEREKFDSVVINNRQGAYDATKYLIDSGHTKIGHLQSSFPVNNFYERSAGFLEALSDSGITYNPANTILLQPSFGGAYEEMLTELEKTGNLPTAFFADNDIIAYGAIKAMKEFGLNLPQDVSIVGFGNSRFCSLMEPKLTTITANKKFIGKHAVHRILERIRGGEDDYVKIEIGTELIVRDSVVTLK